MRVFFERLAASVGVGGVIAFVIFLIILSPMLFLWSLNTLAELGNVKFYIEHSIWSYWVAFVFMMCVRGASGK